MRRLFRRLFKGRRHRVVMRPLLSEKEIRKALCGSYHSDVIAAVNSLIDEKINEVCVDAAVPDVRLSHGVMAGVSGRMESLLELRADLAEFTAAKVLDDDGEAE